MNSYEIEKGIWVYRNALPESLDIINRLESLLEDKNNSYFWKPSVASEDYRSIKKDYRDCYDFKIKKDPTILNKNKYWLEADSIWQDCYDAMINPISEYSNKYKIQMNYMEAFNFIKYGPNEHFSEHSDHGHSYVCTLSAVGYFNDNYDGGELYFNNFNLKIKPEKGDLYLFPSTYLFSHAALPVTNGTKYSLVTMLDYNDQYHKGN